jgi:hypothetical protein
MSMVCCLLVAPIKRLDLSGRMFHLCSHASRDAGDRTEPRLEGAYALRQRLPPGDALNARGPNFHALTGRVAACASRSSPER